MNFADNAEDAAFRQEVRRWFSDHRQELEEMFGAERSLEVQRQVSVMRRWHRMANEAGLSGIHWPKEYGGGGGTLRQQLIFQEEMSTHAAPERLGASYDLVGPLILKYGTEAQKARYIPPILRGEELWCQGFSEPGGGSDLAAVRMAVTRGDDGHFIINGQKIWTSYAPFVDFCLVLARTNKEGQRHAGLTLFLVPLRSPGITIRPIRDATGDSHFNEVFYDDVRLPSTSVLGEVDGGWKVLMEGLSSERGVTSVVSAFSLSRLHREIVKQYVSVRRDEDSDRRRDADSRLAYTFALTEALRINAYRNMSRILNGEPPGREGAITPIVVAELGQMLQDLAVDVLHPAGVLELGATRAIANGAFARGFVEARALSIVGGTTQIQKNIVAERWLGLPRGR